MLRHHQSAAAVATAAQAQLPPLPQRRVVVTGLGLVTPLGLDVGASWDALLDGRCGIQRLDDERFEAVPSRVAGRVDGFDADALLGVGTAKRMAPFIQYALAAAREACEHAGWDGEAADEAARRRAGVAIGSGIGSIDDVVTSAETLASRGHRRVSPHFVPRMLVNLASGQVSLRHALRGPNLAPATACAAGAHAIMDAFRAVRFGDADIMVAGGAESCVTPLALSGFCRLQALATAFNDDPEAASRPFDARRAGFVMAEGAGVLVLEALDHALARGATPIAEIRGAAASGDAHHVTAPAADGDGAKRAMEGALRQAGMRAEDVDHVNAHATSTPLGDAIEARAIDAVLRRGGSGHADGACRARLPIVSATKGATGHLLGAAGAVEAAFTVLAVANNVAPPTLNLEAPDAGADTDENESESESGDAAELAFEHAARTAIHAPIDAALCNSFGFGGTNVSLAFSKYKK